MRVQLYDTTLRDGSQRESISFSVNDKIKILKKLDEFGVDYVEGGWPGSNPKDVEFFEKVQKIDLKKTKVTAFGSTRRPHTKVSEDPSIKALLAAGTSVVTIFGKSWDLHVTEALNTTLEENLKMIEDSVSYLKEQGLELIYDAEHFFDGFRQNKEYAMSTLRAAQRGGADIIVLCDTNGGVLPLELQEIVIEVKKHIGIPLGMHSHDDAGMSVANSLIAVQMGFVQIQGTINGYGERCGNANLSTIIPNLKLKLGFDCGVSDDELKKLTELSLYVAEIANLKPSASSPFVGSNAFAHKGGVHVDAVMKQSRTYEHITPETVGNRRRILVSELSGKSNILHKARESQLLLSKDVPATKKVLEKLKQMEYEGYQFEGAEASFELLIWKTLNAFESKFELVGFRVIVEKRKEDAVITEATIKVKVGEKILLTAAEGNGPVNALDHALRKALEEVFPAIKNITLLDYKVRVLEGADGTGSRVRVLIESRNGKKSWSTIGVSANIIEASWIALVDSIEYGLMYQEDPSFNKMRKKIQEFIEVSS